MFLQAQSTVLNTCLFFVTIAYIFRYFKSWLIFKICISFGVFIFLVCSTKYLPHTVAHYYEKKFLPLNKNVIQKISGKTYIHVLGSGYAPNDNIPALSQLGIIAMGRMAESIRLYNLLDTAIIITSGKSVGKGFKSQAQILKQAIVDLGIDSNKIEVLNTPSNTQEEAFCLKKLYGSLIQVIVVTDALHMPRAIKTFQNAGFAAPIAAPVNFRAATSFTFFSWLPSAENLLLSDKILHEYLGSIKSFF